MSKRQLRYKLDSSIGKPSDWTLTFAIHDNVAFDTECEFCRRTGQRLSHEVRRETQSLWVCQRCVARYAINGEIEGVVVYPADARNRLHSLSLRLKQDASRNIISAINREIDDPALVETAAYFDRNAQLSPHHAATLFAALSTLDIRVDVRLFEVQARSKACQKEFGQLVRSDRAMIWPALSFQQQQRLSLLGHAPYGTLGQAGNRRSAVVDRASHVA